MAETSPPPALVVLAAGASRRLGRCKALVELGGESVLERLLRAGAALGDQAPLVVSGAHHDEIEAALARIAAGPSGPRVETSSPVDSTRVELPPVELPPVELQRNAEWRLGRSGSVAAAVAARPGRDLCLAPVDVPLVPAALFAALAARWRSAGSPPRGWLAPCLDPRVARGGIGGGARFGHPVLLGRELLATLSGGDPDRPLRALRSAAEPLLALETDVEAILDDLDRPADVERLERLLAAGARR